MAPLDGADEPTLSEHAYSRLQDMIVRLELRPGTTVSEAMLAARLEVGRTPVREALHRLAREHLVLILPRRGVIVPPVEAKAQLRLLEVRRELARVISTNAAIRATPAERQQFQAIADRFEQMAGDGDPLAFLELKRDFDELCPAASKNEYASTAMGLMEPLARRFLYANLPDTGVLRDLSNRHAAIARAIADGDREGAGDAVEALFDRVETFTRSTFDMHA